MEDKKHSLNIYEYFSAGQAYNIMSIRLHALFACSIWQYKSRRYNTDGRYVMKWMIQATIVLVCLHCICCLGCSMIWCTTKASAPHKSEHEKEQRRHCFASCVRWCWFEMSRKETQCEDTSGPNRKKEVIAYTHKQAYQESSSDTIKAKSIELLLTCTRGSEDHWPLANLTFPHFWFAHLPCVAEWSNLSIQQKKKISISLQIRCRLCIVAHWLRSIYFRASQSARKFGSVPPR